MKRKRPNPIHDELRAWPGLEGLSEGDLTELARLVTKVELPVGYQLAVEGTTGRQAFMILEGAAEVTVGGEVVATVGPGRFVGEMALIENDVRSATVTAVTPVTALALSVREFHTVARRPEIAGGIAAALARRVRTLEGGPTRYESV